MKLTQTQSDAIKHKDGPALVLAVPGSGKTTVLIHRAYNLITKHGINPQKILSITFSRASAKDMEARFRNTFKDLNRTPFFSTIHSFCFSIIRDYAGQNNIHYRLIESTNAEVNKFKLLKQIYYTTNNDYIQEDKMDSLINYIGFIKNMMMTPEEFIKHYDIEIKNFKSIYRSYELYKKKHNLLDFDDMLSLTYEILLDNPNILNKYRNQFEYIQVDEGQDTSKLQFEIIKLLASGNNNLFIVADDDQSIYGFRGAYPEGLLDFNKHYKNGRIFYMEQNFRSSKNIVNTSNEFIKTNKIRYKKNIYTNNDFYKSIQILKVRSSTDQYQYIVDDLKDKDLSDCCILYRNNLSSIGIVDFLEKNNIPFKTQEKNLKFFNHWVIQDILNILEFSKDTSNLKLYSEFYYKIKGFISKKQINFAAKQDSSTCCFKRIIQFPNINYYYKNTLNELIQDFKMLSRLKPKDAIEFIEYNLEYSNYLKENSTKFGYTFDNLNKIIYYLKILSNDCTDLDDFRNRLYKIQNLYYSSHKNEGVTLTTVHSAKGLEFDTVYMIDLVEGEFPNLSFVDKSKGDNQKEIEEERRLFYVGMTRAKSNLSLITLQYINQQRMTSSMFIQELINLS